MNIYSFEPFGYDGSLVGIAVSISDGTACTDVIGITDAGVKDFREMVKASVLDCGFNYPDKSVSVCLAPVDLRKYHVNHMFATALAIIAENDVRLKDRTEKVVVVSETDMNGTALPIRGITAALETAAANGIRYAIIPETVLIDAISGMALIKVKNLREAYEKLCSLEEQKVYTAPPKEEGSVPAITFPDTHHLDEITSLSNEEAKNLKWAMTLAAAGRLNMMTIGSHGCGKTISMQCMGEITPDLTADEKSSTQRIYSIAGLDNPELRPFRIPHQTASLEGICGGGPNCRPGEISLAHNGILFLDEAAEFRSSVLQMLRVPLESHNITLSRAGRNTTYPANFQLLMTTNPCPCGNYGSKDKICLCSLKSVDLYWRKFGAPLLDRIDIRYFFGRVDIPVPEGIDLSTKGIQVMVKKAWETQYRRQGKLNCDLNYDEVSDLYSKGTTSDAVTLLDREGTRYGFGVRARASILKIARTMADIQGLEKITAPCIATAVALRKIAANGQPEM